MKLKNYELIEHTADIRLKVIGKDLSELFKNAALAVFNIIAERKDKTPVKIRKIKIGQKADNLEELFINWLNELLSLSSAKGLIFSEFQIDKIDSNSLEAQAMGEDIADYRVDAEIKAATYHQLKIEKLANSWQAEVILDV